MVKPRGGTPGAKSPGQAGAGDPGTRADRRDRRGPSQPRESRSKLYSEEVVRINRCAKVVAGGKRFSFAAFVVLGDSKGKVGYGKGKAKEVASAIDKAVRDGEKRVVPISHRQWHHPARGRRPLRFRQGPPDACRSRYWRHRRQVGPRRAR